MDERGDIFDQDRENHYLLMAGSEIAGERQWQSSSCQWFFMCVMEPLEGFSAPFHFAQGISCHPIGN